MQEATGIQVLVAPARLAQQLTLLALVALCNPYTLFGRDDGQYWAAAFVLPLALAATYRGLHALAAAAGLGRRPAMPFIPLSAMLQLLSLLVQWVDV
ncbi:hypothetical protein PEC18_38340 [Paucibacter sp. O1-1]|uniref:hypothetical protein n=1 Tax=Paucibacter sp. M5-1 TaxID=3015998 RepID=UPI0021D4F019|nr:hypothetical protein [Paucibacter sp. M5-1]MCU7376463.1 hypothetical protein [Paucibacter sp. O1-1]MCZ7883494.1 hypothetical protein [Paucibacter sp. M5-1]MDA3831481.1 hypothetical protein [Paucibacter sp. O1-1]